MGLNKSAEGSDSIVDVRNAIVAFLQRGQSEAASSVLGDQPDADGRYESGHDESKARRETLATFEGIFSIPDEDAAKYATIEEYLTERCQRMMQYPEPMWRSVMDFIETEFGIVVEPATGPTIHYNSCVRGWAQEYGVTEDEIREIIPFEDFKNMDGDAAVDRVLDHFEV